MGAAVKQYRAGDVIVAQPWIPGEDGHGHGHVVGYSNRYPGGLAEQVVLAGSGHILLPENLSPEQAVLTEPLTAGSCAVRRSRIQPHDGAVGVGCGITGLGAVAALTEMGVAP